MLVRPTVFQTANKKTYVNEFEVVKIKGSVYLEVNILEFPFLKFLGVCLFCKQQIRFCNSLDLSHLISFQVTSSHTEQCSADLHTVLTHHSQEL